MMSTPTPDETAPKRSTFLSGREILERSRETVADLSRSLKEAPRRDERSALFCESLEALQRDLSVALGRFFETAPGKESNEKTQYTVEMPRELEDPDPPASIEEAVERSLSLTHTLVNRFRSLATTAPAEELREAYENLAELVSGYEKRIARLSNEEHDL